MQIKVCSTDEEILQCFPVIYQLRPHLQESKFVKTVRLQETESYRLVCLTVMREHDDDAEKQEAEVVAVGGARIMDNLAFGKILYIDDLIVDENNRSKGYGKALFDWFLEHAEENGCGRLHLDSGVQRYAAHRFYLTNRLEIRAHHFCRQV